MHPTRLVIGLLATFLVCICCCNISGACSERSDCSSSEVCAPGGQVGGGTSRAVECSADNDCNARAGSPTTPTGGATAPDAAIAADGGADASAEASAPAATTGALVCNGGVCGFGCASDKECDARYVCIARHCTEKPCATDADCPALLACTTLYAGAARVCMPRACSSDDDCHGGYCVDRTCAAQAGHCSALPS
jgi:hypothetical protein